MVGERPAHAFEHRGPQQQVPHVRRLVLEHLCHEVGSHGSLAAGELPHEPVGIRVSGHRERGEPQARDPALGPFHQQREALLRELDAAGLEQLPGLLRAEAEVGAAELGDHSRDSQPMQAQARILSRPQHQPDGRREVRHEDLEQIERLRGLQLVEVVDHDDDRPVDRSQPGEQPCDDGVPGEGRRRGDVRHGPVVPQRPSDGVDHPEPEPLSVLLAALDGDPRRRVEAGLEPAAQQHGLPATGGRPDERHGAGRSGRQTVAQAPAPDDAGGCGGGNGRRPLVG